jgi:hypothetical protein
MPPIAPAGSGGKLLSLRGSPGTMINISQIEKFTESGLPSGSLSSGKVATPGTYPQKYGKNYLLPGIAGGVHIYGILW